MATWSFRLLSAPPGGGCEGPTAAETVKTSLEDGSVSLSFNYPNLMPSDFFYWYRQNPAEPPEFLLSHSGTGNIVMNKIPELKIEVNKTRLDLLISSAAVTDSAVYYCAPLEGLSPC
uniref:Immunoglobulin V-set domain-containing protein n=1 Tax=Poecilia reticulata TaxID=8081 RepID=A0A3P9PXS2_POERE